MDWNDDKEIADAAEKLYGNIEYLELYVGLQAEQAKPLVDGAGLCPGMELDICEFERSLKGLQVIPSVVLSSVMLLLLLEAIDILHMTSHLSTLHRGALLIVKGIQKHLDLVARWAAFSSAICPTILPKIVFIRSSL